MVNMRKRYDAATKAKIALEAVKGEKTLAERGELDWLKKKSQKPQS